MAQRSTVIIAGTDPRILFAALAVSNRVGYLDAQSETNLENSLQPMDPPAKLGSYFPGTIYFSEKVPWVPPPNGTQQAYDDLKAGKIPWPPDEIEPKGGGASTGLIIAGLAAIAFIFVASSSPRRGRRK